MIIGYCDNQLAAGSTLGQTACKMTCSGDNTQICGGPGALTLFSNIPPTASGTATLSSKIVIPVFTPIPIVIAPPIAGVSKAENFSYVGCANENNVNPGRALPGASYSNDTVTNDECTAFCAEQNFKYAGTEYGRECYCGNDLEPGSVADKTGCTSACAGSLNPDSLFAQYTSICGGGSLLSVWRNEDYKPVQVVPSVGNYASQGCYTEAARGRALSGPSFADANMTVELCVGYCFARGYVYAGVEYGESFHWIVVPSFANAMHSSGVFLLQ
jgi:hypothetical protein